MRNINPLIMVLTCVGPISCSRQAALPSLHILLPRPGSFDEFDPAGFPTDLGDFRAALAGEENPHGYFD